MCFSFILNILLDLPGIREETDPKKTADTQITIGDDVCLTLSASFGVAHYDSRDREWSAVLHRADNALYAAKKQGRNCFVRLWYILKKGDKNLTCTLFLIVVFLCL